MKAIFYSQMINFLNQHPQHEKIKWIVNRLNQIITTFVYISYPIFLFILYRKSHNLFWRAFLTPAVSFVLLSIFRAKYNAPRPYEVLDIQPLIDKKSKGNSFPSRHVFSIFVIAMTIYNFYPLFGFFLVFLGVALAIIRVISGVHFPKDVIVGALVGILASIIGFI